MSAPLSCGNRASSKLKPANRPNRYNEKLQRSLRPVLEHLETRQLLSLTINPTFDATITSDPNAATIEATINRAIATYQSVISDNVTVAITFQEVTTGLGGSGGGLQYFEKYQDYYNALVSHETSANDTTAVGSLPNQANDPINNQSTLNVRSPLARALGFNAPNNGGAAGDGTISLNTSICNLDRTSPQDPNKYDLQAVTSHEIDEILASGSALDGQVNGNAAPRAGLIRSTSSATAATERAASTPTLRRPPTSQSTVAPPTSSASTNTPRTPTTRMTSGTGSATTAPATAARARRHAYRTPTPRPARRRLSVSNWQDWM